MDKTKKTEIVYGFLWSKDKEISPLDSTHFGIMQEAIKEPIVRGERGIDVGSGPGWDTFCMAKENPSVTIVSMDLSDGIYRTKEVTSILNNVRLLKCSVLDAPLKSESFDFAYSFGVLHHTPDPRKGLLEIARVLKKSAPAFLYLYEDHSENPLKCIAVKVIAKVRRVTVRIPPRIMYALCWIFSPAVFIAFSLPAKILRKFELTLEFSKRMPFNFGTGLFSLRGSLYDRFRAPIEYRFSRQEVRDLFAECGFGKVNVARIDSIAGWVAWGYKR